MNFIKKIAACNVTPLAIKHIYKSSQNITKNTLIKYNGFLHRELPIRLAHRIIELYKLPVIPKRINQSGLKVLIISLKLNSETSSVLT